VAIALETGLSIVVLLQRLGFEALRRFSRRKVVNLSDALEQLDVRRAIRKLARYVAALISASRNSSSSLQSPRPRLTSSSNTSIFLPTSIIRFSLPPRFFFSLFSTYIFKIPYTSDSIAVNEVDPVERFDEATEVACEFAVLGGSSEPPPANGFGWVNAKSPPDPALEFGIEFAASMASASPALTKGCRNLRLTMTSSAESQLLPPIMIRFAINCCCSCNALAV
jgi:hypothetical protein